MTLTQKVIQAGFKIKTDTGTDRIGSLNFVTISKDGIRTLRKARKYDEALEACAKARGLSADFPHISALISWWCLRVVECGKFLVNRTLLARASTGVRTDEASS